MFCICYRARPQLARIEFHPKRAWVSVCTRPVRRQTARVNTRADVAKLDRYIIANLLTSFGFFALVLVMVYWINRAVALFDQLIANGHSALVFLEFTTLSLPNVIRLVLPMAGFAAVVWTTNRLQSDSELVVVQSTGFAPSRLARPVVMFGLVLSGLLLVLSHFLVPASRAELNERQAEISKDLTARFLREGVFMHPISGVTFFVGAIASDGQLENVFLADNRVQGEEAIYTARQALFLRNGEQAQLVMLDGMAQIKTDSVQDIAITTFSDLVLDISDFLGNQSQPRPHPRELTTWQLLNAGQDGYPTPRGSAHRLRVEIHERTAQALLAPGAVLVGFATLLIGGFSRFGLWRQIVAAIILIALAKGADNVFISAGRAAGASEYLAYTGPILGLTIGIVLLWIASNPAIFARRPFGRGVDT